MQSLTPSDLKKLGLLSRRNTVRLCDSHKPQVCTLSGEHTDAINQILAPVWQCETSSHRALRRTVQMGQSQVRKDKVERQAQRFLPHNPKATGFYRILSTGFTVIGPMTLSLRIPGRRAKTKSVKKPPV